MTTSRSCFIVALLIVGAVGLVACGGPSDPSNAGVTLRGELEGDGGPAGFGDSAPIVVHVSEAPSLTATVGGDGGFMLMGLPTGRFSLEFTRGSRTLGTLSFSAVKANEQITIRVALSPNGSTIALLEERRDGVGQGEIEFEGNIEAVLEVHPGGDSLYRVAGNTVLARAGVTEIHAGNSRRSVGDLTVGIRVLVKGRWIESTIGTRVVLATDINLREDSDTSSSTGSCLISGGKVGKKIQLEGTVASRSSASFELEVNGNRASVPVLIDMSSSSFKCNGKNKNLPPAGCQATVAPGAQVHVSGVLETCSTTLARVVASQVMVQKP
jgi:hypothetical protein